MNLDSLNIIDWQWILLIGFGLLFFILAPYSKTKKEFFAAKTSKGGQPGYFILTASLLISWIFAKSITNAANLGLKFGIVGGVTYAVYYLSFIVAGIVIYQLRVKGGFKSIHHFLQKRFGRNAILIFSLLIGIRLFNEVWSNTMVIGSYFGEQGSTQYYIAILGFTGITLAYVLKGGLRSSLLTDAIQMLFFGLLLFVLLVMILPNGKEGVGDYLSSGEWTMSTGLNLLFAAGIQIFSYPFHDPVLTDRAFISKPKITLRSFITASIIGVIFMSLFSLIGVYAQFNNLEGQAAVEVSKLFGTLVMLAMNFIMITSAASTLDSTFSSFSKLSVMDLGKKKNQTVKKGRIMMIVIAVAGTLPVFANPEILSATTISGTMVIGLAPIFIFWKMKVPKLSFYLPVLFGIFAGLSLALGKIPDWILFSEGPYAELLWVNVWGSIICVLLFFIPYWLNYGERKNS